MNLRNKVFLIGNVGIEPEIVAFDNGGKIANVVLATNENYKDKNGERQERTEWHRIKIFGNAVSVVENYIHKGKEIAIEGKLVNRSWENKNGEKKYTTEVHANEILLLGGKKTA